LSLDPNKSEIISARPIKRCLELLLGRVALHQKVHKASETIELPEAQGCNHRETSIFLKTNYLII
jgi:hypothetical protein